jgi:hypothetical protein
MAIKIFTSTLTSSQNCIQSKTKLKNYLYTHILFFFIVYIELVKSQDFALVYVDNPITSVATSYSI